MPLAKFLQLLKFTKGPGSNRIFVVRNEIVLARRCDN